MKKKLSSAVFAVFICLAVSLTAFAADIYYNPFEITVTAESGTVLYSQIWNDDMTQSIMRPMTIFVPNGKNLTATDELIFNGETYLEVEYNEFEAYVKSSAVTLKNSEAGEEFAFATTAQRSVAVINKNGVQLRRGPSMAYETASETIPYGTVISYDKINCEHEFAAKWAYTSYNGAVGWLYIGQYGTDNIYDCAYILNENDYYTGTALVLTDGAYLTETPDPQSAKVIESIPAETKFTYKYLYENYDSISVFVEYNGIKGWLNTKNTDYKTATGEKSGVYVLAEKGLPLYAKPLDENAEIIATLPENTNLCVDFQYWHAEEVDGEVHETKWMHVNFNGTDGWVLGKDSSEYVCMFSAYDLKITSESGLNLYSEKDENSEIALIIPNGTAVTVAYESESDSALWAFVEYGGKQGWILAADKDAEYIKNSDKQLDAPHGAQAAENENLSEAPELTEKNVSVDPADDENTVSTKTIIIICVSAAILIAAVIAIITIRKKKSK